MGLRVELFARIRRDARVEGLSIRELARRHGVDRTCWRGWIKNPQQGVAEAVRVDVP